ncbi:uncharacterized protein [Rutidosis leptorrhynchoides]|uniref:uncharacterized protein n=1 Tax=Rutidosis leptorrhynchoides TaxID=125765 RepID=UPI003A99CF0F
MNPKTNGVAERMNRSIMEKVRCMLSHARLDKSFWVEAATTATYLINRSPHRSLEDKIPEEMWSGDEVKLDHLRIFGCPVYTHISEGKLAPQAVKCIFLGYGSGVKGYCVWCPDPKYKKIIHSCDVTFNEEALLNPETYQQQHEPSNKITNMSTNKVELEIGVKEPTEPETKPQTDGPMQTDTEPETQPDYMLARDWERRQTIRPPRYEDYECQLVSYSFTVASQVESIEPKSYKEAISSHESEKWAAAMHEEIKSLHKNET